MADPQATGYRKIGEALSTRTFPTQEAGVGASFSEFVTRTQDEVVRDPDAIRNRVFEQGLRGEVDLSTYFSFPIFEGQEYETIKGAAIKEQQNIPLTPDEQTVLDNARTSGKQFFDDMSYERPELINPIRETGVFPIDLTSGEVMLPEQAEFAQTAAEVNPLTTDSYAVRASKDSANLLDWMTTRRDSPTDPNVRKALSSAMSADMMPNLARRFYDLANFGEEAIRFYLPYFIRTGDFSFNSEERAKAFFEMRTEAEIDGSPFMANRREVVEDMAREELRRQLGDERFAQLGYDEKIDVDGVQRYKKQLVTDTFANALWEQLFDSQTFFEQVGVYMLESAGVTKLFTAPYTVGQNAINFGRRQIAKIRGEDVPLSAQKSEDILAAANARAAVSGQSMRDAARDLAMEGKSNNWWNRWSANRIAGYAAAEKTKQDVRFSITQSTKDINSLRDQIRAARSVGNSVKVGNLNNQLRQKIAQRNWRRVRSTVAGARSFGFNPMFDTSLALSMAAGRNSLGGPLGELAGFGSFLGFKAVQKGFGLMPRGLPVVGPAARSISFRGKLAVEGLFSGMIGLVSVANRGFAEGWLVNPNLRGLMSVDKANLNARELYTLQQFTDSWKNLPDDAQEAFLTNIDLAFEDIRKITEGIPEEFRPEIAKHLSVNLAEATGLNILFATQASQDMAMAGMREKDIRFVRKNFVNMAEVQRDAEKSLAAQYAAVEALDQSILNIERQGGQGAVEAVERLRLLSASYRRAYEFGLKELQTMVSSHAEQAQQYIDELSSSEVFLSSDDRIFEALDNAFDLINRLDKEFRQNVRTSAGPIAVQAQDGTVLKIEGVESLATQQEVRDSSAIVLQAAEKLQNAAIDVVDRTRLAHNADEIIKNSDKQLITIDELARSQSDARINKAYAQISDKSMIPMNPVSSSLLDFLSAMAPQNVSVAKMADPKYWSALGGKAGQAALGGLNLAANRGMRVLFDQPQFLDDFSEASGKTFSSGKEVIQYLKVDFYGSKDKVLAEMGISNVNDMTDLHLIMKLIDDPNVGFDASSLNFVVSPIELEQLRQATNVMIKGANENARLVGAALRSGIDDAFDSWGATLGTDDFNLVVRARTIARLERQRFDKGSFSYDVASRSEGDIPFIQGEGEVGRIAKGDVTGLLTPTIKAIINPSEATARTVEKTMTRLKISYAPTTSTLPDEVLKKGPDGRFVLMETDELSGLVSPVFDMSTPDGKLALEGIRAIMSTALKNEFLTSTGMGTLRTMIRDGKLYNLTESDLPKPLIKPNQFDTMEDYIDAMEESVMVQVKYGEGDIRMEPLFDVREVLTADRQITDVVNGFEEYTQVHQTFVTKVKKLADETGEVSAQLERQQAELLKNVLGYSESTTGSSFLNNVVMSGDARSMTTFLSNIQRTSADSPEKAQAALQGLFVETLNAAGGLSHAGRTTKMFNGVDIPVMSFNTPQQAFLLLDDALTGASPQGRNLRELADAAGVTQEQLETYHAIYRHALRTEAPRLRREDGSLAQTTKGFTLDNALSKAFNIARGMVSTEYVAAEVALRYAALAQGKLLKVILSDDRTARIVKDTLEDPTRLLEEDAVYLTDKILPLVANELSRLHPELLSSDVTSEQYRQAYFTERGVIFEETSLPPQYP